MGKTQYVILKQTDQDDVWKILEAVEAHSTAAAKRTAALDHGSGKYNAVAVSGWGVPTAYEIKQRPVATEV